MPHEVVSPSLPITASAREELPVVDLARLVRTGLAAVVLAMVFALAIADGGRNPTCLFFVQAGVFVVLAATILRGGARGMRLPIAWWCLIGAVGLTTLTSVRPEASVRELLLWLTYGGMAVLTAVALREPRAWFVDGLVLTAGALCLIALFWFWGSGDLTNRWCSTFYWPNPFAAFLLLVLPLAVVRAIRAPSIREAMSHGACSVLFLTSLVFTYSRGAWLAGIITLGIGALVLRGARRAALMRFIAIAVATAAAVGLLSLGAPGGHPSAVATRAASIADSGDSSARGHFLFWRNALHIFSDHPLTGTGPGTFGAVHAAYQTDLRYYARDAHSLYLQTAAETGVTGVLALLALLGFAGSAWARMLRRASSEDERTLVAGIGLGLLAFLLHNAVDMDWAFPANPAMAFVLAGVLGSIAIAQRGEAPTPAAGGKRLPMLAALGLLVATVVVMRMGEANRLFVQGQALAGAGRWEEACDRFVQAQAWNPLHARYLGAEADARMRLLPPQRARAESALRRAMRLDRANAWQPFQLATVLASSPGAGPREFVEPERLLLGALRLDPLNRPKVYSALAQLYVAWGRQPDAAKVYDTAVARYLVHPPGEARVPLPGEVIDLMAEAAEYRLSAGDVTGATTMMRDVLTDGPRAMARPGVREVVEKLKQRGANPLS